WKLCTTMKAGDVTDTLTMALQASGCDSARVMQRPRLLSDNGPSYVSSDLAEWLSDKGMDHTRRAPCHPQTQGKIRTEERRGGQTWALPILEAMHHHEGWGRHRHADHGAAGFWL